MRTILVTGFRAFGGEPRNPSGEIAGDFRGVEREGCRVEATILPVSRAQVLDAVAASIDRCRPVAVVATALALTRAVVSVEEVARNREDYELPDEVGQQPRGEPVVEGGPEELRATLFVEEIAREIRDAGVPARVSRDAGAGIANRLLYGLLHQAARAPEGGGFRAVLLQLPPLPESVAATDNERPSMVLDLGRAAVEAAIRVAARALAERAAPPG